MMRVIIDLIEDVREQIGNHERYEVMAGLLKTDTEDSQNLKNHFQNVYNI